MGTLLLLLLTLNGLDRTLSPLNDQRPLKKLYVIAISLIENEGVSNFYQGVRDLGFLWLYRDFIGFFLDFFGTFLKFSWKNVWIFRSSSPLDRKHVMAYLLVSSSDGLYPHVTCFVWLKVRIRYVVCQVVFYSLHNKITSILDVILLWCHISELFFLRQEDKLLTSILR